MPDTKEREKEKATKGKGFFKLLLFLLIVAIVLGVSLYAFLDINPADIFVHGVNSVVSRIVEKGTEELTEKEKVILSCDENEPLSVAAVSDDLVVADNSSVRVIDMDGREKAYFAVNLKKPYVQTNNKDILVADLEGNYISIINDGNKLWEKNFEEGIVYASLSDNWVLLITKSKESGYKRSIRAWSKDGQEVSIRNISNYYPFAVHHYPDFDNATFVASGVDISGLEANGFFEFLDPTMNQKASIKGDQEIMVKGVPLKDNLLLYGEKSLILVDHMYKTIWEKKFTESKLTSVNVIDGKYPVIAELDLEAHSRENHSQTDLKILNEDSSERKTIEIDDAVTGIVTQGRTAACIAGSEVLFINSDGDIMDTYTSKSGVLAVCLAREDLAYIVTSGEIRRVNINVTHKFLGIF